MLKKCAFGRYEEIQPNYKGFMGCSRHDKQNIGKQIRSKNK